MNTDFILVVSKIKISAIRENIFQDYMIIESEKDFFHH